MVVSRAELQRKILENFGDHGILSSFTEVNFISYNTEIWISCFVMAMMMMIMMVALTVVVVASRASACQIAILWRKLRRGTKKKTRGVCGNDSPVGTVIGHV